MAYKSFWITTLLFTLIYLILATPYYPKHNIFASTDAKLASKLPDRLRVLILTAHPDDECMFFAPTLLGLAQAQTGGENPQELNEKQHTYADVFSLCLSSGDADGLGEIRKAELEASLDVLGVERGRRWVLDEPFHDNITEFWDAKLIAEHVQPIIKEHKIDIILTFDERGISSHPNHISLYRGVQFLLSNPSHKSLRAFSLKTTSLLPKYTGVTAALLAQLSRAFCTTFSRFTRKLSFIQSLFPPRDLYFSSNIRWLANCDVYDGDTTLFVSGWTEYATALRAMKQHRSQLVWFRWLYVAFSRYKWINEWVEISG